MENLLASIRQAIDSDLGTAAPVVRQPTAASIKGAMEELRVKANAGGGSRSFEVTHEINELREKISRNRSFTPEPKTPFAQIMAGQVKLPSQPSALPVPVQTSASYAAAPTAQQSYPAQGYTQPESQAPFETEKQDWQEDTYTTQDYEPEPQLLSHESAYAAQSSFNELAQALMARATGERSIEDITQELLRTMLRNWLDANLPSLVERLVREEIERVARRGR